MPPPQSAICPRCRQHAPIVLRGMAARCTVCGAPRLPFGVQTLNLAGSAARFGGGAARFVGWSVLVVGLAIALGIGLLLQTLFPGGFAGLAIGIPIAIASLFFGIAFIVGGGKLHQSGVAKRRAAELETIHALAKHRKGVVTAAEAARALDMDEARADALLTELARDEKQGVCLDLDDDGRVLYLFGGEELNPRWRIADPPMTTDKARAEAEAEAEADLEASFETHRRFSR